MSYQTLSPSFLQPFISATNLTFPPALFCQGRSACGSPEMEYTDGLKAGFWQEEGSNGGGEDFFVDDLLDLSNQDDFEAEEGREGGEEEEEEEESNASVPESQADSTSRASNGSSSVGVLVDSVDELAVPVDELADLEWLSHFVEDSFSSGTGALPYSAGSGGEPRAPVKKPSFPLGTRVPMRARSKLLRTGRVWSCRDGFPESSSSSSASSTSSSCLNSVRDLSLRKKRPGKRRNRVGKVPENAPVRRCSHCLVQKTPQWRAGPLGSKTLCNACGVRYKSGRLLPEYRPAGSPTFLSDVHSNNHRKVLEMRRQKETTTTMMMPTKTLPESGLPAVESC